MITLADVEDRVAALCDDVRGRLLAVPGKWAPELQGIDAVGDIQTVLREAMVDVLTELSGQTADG